MDINNKLESLQADLADVSTETLRLELQRRVEMAKAKKENRIKELQDVIQKAQLELKSLIGERAVVAKTKNQKVLDGLPNIVKASMPKELRDSLENGEEISQVQQPIPQPKVKKSQSNQQSKRCDNCGATASNWEYSPNDDSMYCVCGNLVAENVSASGFVR